MPLRFAPAFARWTAVFALLSSTLTLAQERGFRVHRFDPPTAGSTSALVDRPWYSSTRVLSLGVTADYALRPVVPRLPPERGAPEPIISDALLGHLDVAGSFLDRVLLSGSLPLALLERGGFEPVSRVGALSGVGLGDPRLGAMVRLLGQPERDAFSLHFGADVWIPIGAASIHQGDSAVRVRPRAVLAGAFGVGRWSFEGAFLFRQYASLGPPALGLTAASEAQASVSIGVALFDGVLTLAPEARFSTQVVGENALRLNGMSLEVMGGASLLIARTIRVGAAGGAGLLGATGTPELRGVVRIAFAPAWSEQRSADEPQTQKACPDGTGCAAVTAGDADADGVPDANDRCPLEPETPNGVRDDDGCPEYELEPGAPLVRVLTASRAAPARPSPVSRVATTAPTPATVDAGAPVIAPAPLPDADGDGVPDEADRCPVTAEDRDDFEDEDGCPEADNDEDGISDVKDRCPLDAETKNGVDDDDGCPDLAPDADGDGVADAIDRCPLEPESLNDVRDDDGCPEYVAGPLALLPKLLAPAPTLEPAATPAPADSDRDGLDDAVDRCPLTPEDRDDFEDEDGCPEPDNDDDGLADAKDRCPLDAETLNGVRDDDGCPDEAIDVDQDSVPWDDDRCPLEPGNSDDGCPHLPLPALALEGFPAFAAPAPTTPDAAPERRQPDFDRDGVFDDDDRCPVSAEDVDGFEDDDGCPEPDNDGDGIADAKDTCPLEAETINGNKDDDGCPDPGQGVVSIKGNAVVIDGIIRFKPASATLEAKSLPLLKQVAATLRSAATLSVEIQGHTDDVGSAAGNLRLSKKRAEAIKAVLVKNGVSSQRLVATGYGPTRPRASNKTAPGREQNRRVEFLILGEAK